MSHNLIKILSLFVFALDIGVLWFFHDRLSPILDDLLPHGDDEIFNGVTQSDVAAFVLVGCFFFGQVMAWFFLFTSEYELFHSPENLAGGELLRVILTAILVLVPLVETALSAKLFFGERTDAFALVRQTSPTVLDTAMNYFLAAMFGLIAAVIAYLNAWSLTMRVRLRDEAEAEALLAEETPPSNQYEFRNPGKKGAA